MLTKEWYAEIHRRLLSGDPTAPAELVQDTLDILVHRLRKRYPSMSDPNLLVDAVTDGLIDYLKEPSYFDPKKLDLPAFLTMAADRNVRNSLAKLNRRKKREFKLDDVEQLLPDRNNSVEDRMHGQLHGERIRDAVVDLLDDRELEIFNLMAEGVRKTSEYAQVLGIADQPVDQQRLEVKRCKDRIKKRLQRNRKGIIRDEH